MERPHECSHIQEAIPEAVIQEKPLVKCPQCDPLKDSSWIKADKLQQHVKTEHFGFWQLLHLDLVQKTAYFTSFQTFFCTKTAFFCTFFNYFLCLNLPRILQNRFKKDYVALYQAEFRMDTQRHYCKKCGLKNNKCKCEKLK